LVSPSVPNVGPPPAVVAPKPTLVTPPRGTASVAPNAASPVAPVAPVAPAPTVQQNDAPPAPPASPVSVLQWSAAPVAITIQQGDRTTLSVTVRNPSDGVVTLPVPLACASLENSSVCPTVAQLVEPHTQRVQTFTVDATSVAPGSYDFQIEQGLFSVPITVIPNS
jgi:hypothetical protein